jgi:signal transduction histidine kinase
LSAGLVVLFYALLGWRSYDERRRLLAELRPFVGGPRLVEAMLDDTRRESREQETGDRRQKTVLGALEGLRQEVLHARRAGVMALGASAPLFGEALFVPTVEPEQAEQALKAVAALAASGIAPNELCRPAAPSGEWEWVVPLWNAGGLGGALLLGPKEDGGLYTQEEIEAGQAAAERLVDLQAGAEMARRLMYLTRQRSAESQVVDRRTRRTLHDDVLPTLHAAMLTVESDPSGAAQALAGVHHRLADLLHELPNAAAANSARLGLAPALRMMVEDEFAGAFDETQWHVAPDANSAAALLSPVVVETVYYAAREAIRNAARHARRDGPLRLSVALEMDGPTLQVWVQDNGAGFRSADPTRGGGHGLALHSTLLAVLGGALSVENRDGWGTSILIRI